VDGKDSGVFRVAPMARLNASDGMATPVAQEAYEKMYDTLGGKPVHHTLAIHWARLVEMVQAAETMIALCTDPEITGDDLRNIPTATPDEGVGIIEAPRGTLIHHYQTDEKGIIKKANLIVATVNNGAAVNMSINKAARALIQPDKEITEGLLNRIEMAWRPYDLCLACASHNLPGHPAMPMYVYNKNKQIVKSWE
jgi:F420-non-reducing hydrogenase large subunit